MISFILSGMQFGDEGKGSFVDYLTFEQNADCVVRYNGGSQASHTVTTPNNIVHKFSQLGSGMFSDKCHTYLTENMVINLDNLFIELQAFLSKSGYSISELMDRIHIHESCYVVTPYHKLINKLRELSKGDDRRGTVGTGVSEVKYLLSEPKIFPQGQDLGVKVNDVFNEYTNNNIIGRMEALQSYVKAFYKQNEKTIWENVPDFMEPALRAEVEALLDKDSYLKVASTFISQIKHAPIDFNFNKCIYTNYELTLRKHCKTAIFEGSQGLLIDGKYGIKPNTTYLDTTNNFALDISYYRDKITKVGIAKAFTTRHGLGIFPTETTEVSEKISDSNQDESFWNGKIRFGWFDAVLLRYAQKINQVDELYLSALDQFDDFETIKVCNSYYYNGPRDEKFDELFEYTISEDVILIRNIKKPDDDIGKYLKYCTPKYKTVKGWKSDVTKITDKNDLPIECSVYIELLQMLVEIPITLISVGPTRENKIRM